ncbi:MAG: class D sortase [Clostridiales bacterium]|nr:class D sortase [Clostridiales bacterium]
MLKSLDKEKKLLISNILLVLAALILIGGIIFVGSDIIKRNQRQEKIDEGTDIIQQAIDANASSQGASDDDILEPVVTMVIDPSSLEISGEDYDYYPVWDDETAEQIRAVNDELNEANTGSMVIEGVGILEIPSIELRVPIWEGTRWQILRYGVGHYYASVIPGGYGNCTILGHHMLKYGSIFNRLEEVQIGDEIIITDVRSHVYTYIVDELDVVTADDLINHVNGGITDTRQVTLVTCVYTSTGKQRLLVIGHIQDGA